MIRTSGKSSRVIFIVLRFMRTPIMALVAVYAVSMVGWVMIPGQTPDGQSERLSFFHAFYFLTYTATTTGFGEIPYPFSDAQRMWGILSLYGSVIAWLYRDHPSGTEPLLPASRGRAALRQERGPAVRVIHYRLRLWQHR
jgi:hypothetical protein